MAKSQDDAVDNIVKLLSIGGTLGDLYEFEARDYEAIYSLGMSYYEQGRWGEAMKIFALLILHNHLEKRYLFAFAATLQVQKRYDAALQYYSLASMLDLQDPRPTFHSAECLKALGMVSDARLALEIVLEQTSAEQYATLRQRAQSLLETDQYKSNHEGRNE